MARKHGAEQRQRPPLERFGHQCVVRVGAGPFGHRPGRVPLHPVLVHQQPHQFDNGDRRMRVIQLNGPARRELLEAAAAVEVQPNHVLERARDEEELLAESELLSDLGLVVRIQHFRDRLRLHLLVDRAVVVADVERVEVERLGGFGLPQPQQVGGGRVKARHRRVVGDALDALRRNPPRAVTRPLIAIAFGTAEEPDVVGVTSGRGISHGFPSRSHLSVIST